MMQTTSNDYRAEACVTLVTAALMSGWTLLISNPPPSSSM